MLNGIRYFNGNYAAFGGRLNRHFQGLHRRNLRLPFIGNLLLITQRLIDQFASTNDFTMAQIGFVEPASGKQAPRRVG